jgi:sulfur-carrier protein
MTVQGTVTLMYFAWVREKIGLAREDVSLPDGVATVADLIAWLRARGPEYEAAFARPDVIRAAINQAHVKPSASLAGAREIAFFPPVTGG